jgi:hypothetical protein
VLRVPAKGFGKKERGAVLECRIYNKDGMFIKRERRRF